MLLALSAVAAAVVGPRILGRAREAYAPVARMKGEQQEFERWAEGRNWTAPAQMTVTAERLDAFLALRAELRGIDNRMERSSSRLAGSRRPSFSDIAGLMRGIGSLVTDRLAAFRRHDMTPAEYDYLEGIVYGTWLPGLTAAGSDPVARDKAVAAIEEAARKESGAVRNRLRHVAAELRARPPAAPAGIPEEVHRVLLSRAAAIEAQPADRVFAHGGRGRRRRGSPPPKATVSPAATAAP